MSIPASKAVWNMGGLRPTQKLILAALADFADDTGVAWPSARRLADMTGLGVRAVREALKALRCDGVLVLVERGGGRRPDGKPRTTKYRIACPPFNRAPSCTLTNLNGAPDCTSTVHGGAPLTVHARSPEPSIQPPGNHQSPPPPSPADEEAVRILAEAGVSIAAELVREQNVSAEAAQECVDQWYKAGFTEPGRLVNMLREPGAVARLHADGMRRRASRKRLAALERKAAEQTAAETAERERVTTERERRMCEAFADIPAELFVDVRSAALYDLPPQRSIAPKPGEPLYERMAALWEHHRPEFERGEFDPRPPFARRGAFQKHQPAAASEAQARAAATERQAAELAARQRTAASSAFASQLAAESLRQAGVDPVEAERLAGAHRPATIAAAVTESRLRGELAAARIVQTLDALGEAGVGESAGGEANGDTGGELAVVGAESVELST